MNELFGKNLRKIITGAAIIGAGLVPKESIAKDGLVDGIKDKKGDKIEAISGGVNKKDSIFYNWEGDKIGMKYPFEKVYKSDENFYRTVGYGISFDFNMANLKAKSMAQGKIFREEMKIKGGYEARRGSLKVIDSKAFKDNKGVFTVVVAIEVAKKDVVLIETSPADSIMNKVDGLENKIEEASITESNLEEGGEEINNTPENPSKKKLDYQVTFEDFKKAQEAEFDAHKKAQEAEFDQFKEKK